jgi:hypothetical protein
MKRHTNAFLDARVFFSLMCFTALGFSPATAQTEGPIIVICHYLQNGQEDWTIDLSARTASVEGFAHGTQTYRFTASGVVTEITERQITWQVDTGTSAAPRATTYKLNRYTLNLTRNQGPVFGDEPPIPCELRRKQL